jgi:hypothetical protein
MSFLQVNNRQIQCLQPMLQYSIFYLLPDTQPNTWRLYSKPAYLLLERKFKTFSTFSDVSAQQRLNRLLLVHTIELFRYGDFINIPNEACHINANSKIYWNR